MLEVGVAEAQSSLGQLLDRVEHGEEITITRDGKEVARLVPAGAGDSRARAHAAAESIRALSKGVTLGGLRIKDLVDEGRL